MNRCVHCGHEGLTATTVEHEIRVGERVVRGELAATACPACRESYVALDAVERLEQAVAREVIQHGYINGPSFRFLRKVLGINGKELAEQLGTTPETVSRWETGARDVDRHAWLSLAMLVSDELDGRTTARDLLAACRKPTPMPSVIKLAS